MTRKAGGRRWSELTPAERKAITAALGEAITAALGGRTSTGEGRPRPSRAGSGGYSPSRCMAADCGATFDRAVDETRHLNATGHGRYEAIPPAPKAPS